MDWKTHPHVLAECQDCKLVLDVGGERSKAAKAEAIRHARKMNHKMRIEITVVYYYEDPKADK